MYSSIPNRTFAGQALAEALKSYRDVENVIVLALPRGGVPVAFEIAKALNAPLDLMLVRKLGTPSHPELAMGAIASGDIQAVNYFIAQKYVEALGQFANSPNQKTLLLPMEATGILGSLAGIAEVAKAALGKDDK